MSFILSISPIVQYCTIVLSNDYFNIIRDRLYCDTDPRKSGSTKQRNSALATLKIILDHLLVWLSPILSFTCEEIQQILDRNQSIFEKSWCLPKQWENNTINNKFTMIWSLRDEVNIAIEKARNEKKIGSSTEAIVQIPKNKEIVGVDKESLQIYCIVSEIEFLDINTIVVSKSSKSKCPRCWLYRDIDEVLCMRCEEVIRD